MKERLNLYFSSFTLFVVAQLLWFVRGPYFPMILFLALLCTTAYQAIYFWRNPPKIEHATVLLVFSILSFVLSVYLCAKTNYRLDFNDIRFEAVVFLACIYIPLIIMPLLFTSMMALLRNTVRHPVSLASSICLYVAVVLLLQILALLFLA